MRLMLTRRTMKRKEKLNLLIVQNESPSLPVKSFHAVLSRTVIFQRLCKTGRIQSAESTRRFFHSAPAKQRPQSLSHVPLCCYVLYKCFDRKSVPAAMSSQRRVLRGARRSHTIREIHFLLLGKRKKKKNTI